MGEGRAGNSSALLYTSFGDPDLRVLVPGKDYSSNNYWKKDDTKPLRYIKELSLDVHMPFGVTGYPHEKIPLMLWQQYLRIIIFTILIATIIGVAIFLLRRKR